ncbi:MAG: aspartate aminotransferase family protein [Micavibrio aeruginosavorus]|uniref:Aspartate aminotransferase family protein n=1 Tax=Micavibrio aeruginosavorus TaxID=349221 RepID=A0A2W4ZZP7_9BACT|nr:MAG: aspartate aminotransferase family protein [Micavibrio aeruginosavorus]
MADTDFLDRANDILINVYGFWPVQFAKGKGVYLYDTDKNKYLDFGAGIAVNALGYAHPRYTKALKKQIDTLHMGLCYVADEQRMEAAETILAVSEFEQVFFCSTGAEAVEGALKTARKWAKETKGADCTDIIYVKNSFHGRTMGALSVIGQAHYREPFEPLMPGTHEATFNDLASIERLMSDKTAAVIIEPVMGEGGIISATQEFIEGLRALCTERDVCLIFDEVQCGMGRLGTIFAYEHFGVVPDMICLAKGLGAGFPVGAFMGMKKYTSHITAGTHGSTYGGNPLACTAVTTVIKELLRPGFLENVEETGKILKDGLEQIARETNLVSEVRGEGLMLAANYNGGPVKDFVKKLLKNGLIALSCGENSLRLVPPLILTPKEAKEGLAILRETLAAV